MSITSIKVENLSKRYRIGSRKQINDTFVGMIASIIKAPFHNYKRLRKLINFSNNSDKDVIWALRDVTFHLEKGDVLGVIGRNGAGKSTLLKILSRITDPTFGSVEITGRVSSLLEVGTGFHPELTGRENVYLNGTILGMTKKEINTRFDEIVNFAEMEKFIDTPIKWYSSGMKVRLAFSVAAHLEPEIMIIDEVLAVGDTEFQKKCLGKMENVAHGGRTVLFVSHNLNAINSLCPKSILLENGTVTDFGKTGDITFKYLDGILNKEANLPLDQRTNRQGNGAVKVCSFRILNSEKKEVDYMKSGNDYIFEIGYKNFFNKALDDVVISLDVFDEQQNLVLLLRTTFVNQNLRFNKERGYVNCEIKELPLANGTYSFKIFISHHDTYILDWISDVAKIPVSGGNFFGTGSQGLPEKCKFLYKCRWSSK